MTAADMDLRRAPAAPGVRTRLRRSRMGLTIGAAFLALVVVMVVAAGGTDTAELSTRSTTANGTRALAQILERQGVEVRQIDRLAAARVEDPSAATVALVNPGLLTGAQLESLAAYPGDLLLLGASDEALAALGVDATTAFGSLGGTAPAGCTDPDAVAAGRIDVGLDGLRAEGDVEACFTTRDGVASMVRAEVDGRTVTVVTAVDAFTNARLAEEGNAALALRLTGRHPLLIWYLSDGFDASLMAGERAETPEEIEAAPDFLPPGTGAALYALGIAVVFAAVWRGRRFGPLLREPLPVVVRASESTRGRARLYRRVRASGRAGAALRASAALRMGARIGVPRSAPREGLVAALTRATGRPERQILDLLYGPPPQDDAALMTLIRELDALESEVHRP